MPKRAARRLSYSSAAHVDLSPHHHEEDEHDDDDDAADHAADRILLEKVCASKRREREEVSAVHASVRRGQKSARTERVEKVEVDAEAIKQRRPHRRRQEWELVRLLAPQSNGLLQGLAARYQLDREPDRPLVALEVWMCCGHPYIVYPVRAASPQRLVA